MGWIDARDIGAVAAEVLTGRGHEGKAYTLTGPEALTVYQVAEILTEAVGKKVTYVDVPEEAARKGMEQAGMPDWAVDALLELHGICKMGLAAGLTPAVEQITGGKPTPFRKFAIDFAKAFR